MQNNATRMVVESKEPLLAALTSLSAHSSKILSSWNKLLKRYRLCRKHVALLSGLRVAPQLRDLIFANPQSYREKSERQGQDLAHSGVPPECVTVAVALYVESCLPFLLSDEPGEVAWVTAFARWASIYQFFLLTGYAQHSAVERQAVGGENRSGGASFARLFRSSWRGLREGTAPPRPGPSRRNRARLDCPEALYRGDRTGLEEG